MPLPLAAVAVASEPISSLAVTTASVPVTEPAAPVTLPRTAPLAVSLAPRAPFALESGPDAEVPARRAASLRVAASSTAP